MNCIQKTIDNSQRWRCKTHHHNIRVYLIYAIFFVFVEHSFIIVHNRWFFYAPIILQSEKIRFTASNARVSWYDLMCVVFRYVLYFFPICYLRVETSIVCAHEFDNQTCFFCQSMTEVLQTSTHMKKKTLSRFIFINRQHVNKGENVVKFMILLSHRTFDALNGKQKWTQLMNMCQCWRWNDGDENNSFLAFLNEQTPLFRSHRFTAF